MRSVGPFPIGASRPLGFALLGVLALALTADLLWPRGSARANGILDERFFLGFSDYDAETKSRLGHTASRIEIPGLPRGGRAEVTLELSSSEPRTLRIFDGGGPVGEARLSGSPQGVFVLVQADSSGTAHLRLEDSGGKKRGIFSLGGVLVRGAPGAMPTTRLLLEAALVALLGLLAAWGFEAPLSQVLALLVPALPLLAAVLFERLYAFAYAPFLLRLLLAGLAFVGLAELLGVPRSASRVLVPVFVLRLGLAVLPSFPSIDVDFHAHNVERFRSGEVLKSRAPGAARGESLPVPYPPALYAILAPLAGGADAAPLVRLAGGLLEGTAPLLLFLVVRGGGGSPDTAGAAAVVNACLPESVLILGKGVAANMLGSSATLLVAWALVRGVSLPLLAALLTLTFLSHLGASVCLLFLLLFLLVSDVRSGETRRARTILVATLIASGFAWLIYYREVVSLTLASIATLGRHLQGTPSSFVRVRFVRLGKTAQDLLLKFGGGSLVLAFWGQKRLPERLGRLVRAWMWAGVTLGWVAILTPIPLRFEYFLTAPVSIVAGFGADALKRSGRGRLVTVLLAASLFLEVLIGVFLLFQRFSLISVIQESDRWLFPFLWDDRVTG
ncbi:MAG TPA: hypothetical protein VN083_03705 [Vicinamibacteria bacterium]|nr:hypothetical protein [Vicinamibacteria bacterium]